MEQNTVVVVGSINIDLVARAARMPAPGETVLGTSFATTPGGKGSNQAIAAAKAGADVAFVGAVGDDTFALELRQTLVDAEVDAERLREVPGPSGVAAITVDSSGQNSIIVVPGANSRVVDLTHDELAAIADADVLLCQLEIPLDTVTAAARHAAAHGTVVILNPSPAQPLPDGLVDAVDVLVVNETEERQLGENALTRVQHVVTTLGADGARYRGPGGEQLRVAAPSVDAVDTTGAGDAFAGALASAWSRGPLAALTFACAAGALTATRPGASAASPTRAEIEEISAADA
ncbi:ribokinase [Prescottella equi]|uniref:Ribokinase n=1 Tax=Rhodococcus hoagii TaxID=43767 RepID=A0AAE5IUI7_RHOHA|nr:ribokinase [Prescottella equi]ERN45034.1 ribokinase [Prescottella equi NBRC 101255 = C 7]MBM4630036.1 ribokinase [Prescottella equi]ORL29298.1 ribokinase [Prescottella equi]ORM05786.1 ribokinase [Prescottella equi]ORM29412.1 ribokinase [Prescottella equi]